MNTLSWLIYVAEVSERARDTAAVILFIIGFMGGFGVVFLWAVTLVEGVKKKTAIVASTIWVAVVIPTMVLSAALPSKATIYMIAASEAGEKIVTSPDAIEMMGDLKAIIKKRLKDELEAK